MITLEGMSPLAIIVLRLLAFTHHCIALLKAMLLVGLSVPELAIYYNQGK